MALMNFLAIYIILMLWKILPIAIIHLSSRIQLDRAICFIVGLLTVMTTTVQPRWGKIGKQKIEDAGELYPKRMETVDDEILDNTIKFMDKAKKDGKPFFVWLNPNPHACFHASFTKI